MIISTILLTEDNFYVDSNGNLPERPTFDKNLLTELCRGEGVSATGYKMLPPSIRDLVKVGKPDMPITIREIGMLTDLLIVSRSTGTITEGKQFRLDDFKLLVKDTQVEIWKRK